MDEFPLPVDPIPPTAPRRNLGKGFVHVEMVDEGGEQLLHDTDDAWAREDSQ